MANDPDAVTIIRELLSALDRCTTQIEQMFPLFDDDSESIRDAVKEAEDAVERAFAFLNPKPGEGYVAGEAVQAVLAGYTVNAAANGSWQWNHDASGAGSAGYSTEGAAWAAAEQHRTST